MAEQQKGVDIYAVAAENTTYRRLKSLEMRQDELEGRLTNVASSTGATSVVKTNLILLESAAKGDALRASVGDNEYLLSSTYNADSNLPSLCGFANKLAPTADRFVNMVKIKLKKVGSPSDLSVHIRTPDANGTTLASGTLPASSVSSAYQIIAVDLDKLISVENGTTYYIVFLYTTCSDATNYYVVASNGFVGGPGDTYANYNGTTWSYYAYPALEIYYGTTNEEAGKVKKASAVNATTADLFLGFCGSDGAAGASVPIEMKGLTTTVSGLTVGRKYYLTDTPGVIGTTPGTATKYVGFATGSNSLFIA